MSVGGGEGRITAVFIACVVVAVALPVLWLLGFDAALPVAGAFIVVMSPLGMAATLKEHDDATPGQWWRRVRTRFGELVRSQRGIGARLVLVGEMPLAVLAALWFALGTVLLVGWRRLRRPR
jgi:hypothetical protein